MLLGKVGDRICGGVDAGVVVPPLLLGKVGVGTGVGVGVGSGLFAASIEAVLLVPLLAGVTLEVCVTTSEITLVRVTGGTVRVAATSAEAVTVVIVVMQVPHRLGHGGGGVVLI